MQLNRFPRHDGRGLRARSGFTLIEILVVLAIIAILAAILFPTFRSAQENSRQAACQANLQQIYTAVRLYYDDEKQYPGTLAVLLPQTANLNNTNNTAKIDNKFDCDAGGKCPNSRGTGYLKSNNVLLCPDDDTDQSKPISSYGDTSTQLIGPYTPGTNDDKQMGRFVWNYFGYKDDGTAYPGMDAAADTAYRNDLTSGGDKRFLTDPTKTYDPVNNPVNSQLMPRLYNRYAKPDTIITHCVFHRVPLAQSLGSPNDLYATPANDSGAKDIILRADGTAKLIDVVTWKTNKTWVKQVP